ncbi:MAG: alpha-amylase [Chloroflexi bacterium]|nr:alpha-amylase [Chloroflexota bacterium]
MFEFHVSRAAREHYQFDESLFRFDGNVIFPNFHAARVFAQKMNEKRDAARRPEGAVRAGQINALGLIDEIWHLIFELYRHQTNPALLREALAALEERLGRDALDNALRAFVEHFPPLAVHRGDMDIETYLQGRSGELSHREIALQEMLMLWLANQNPAFSPFRELFGDDPLAERSAYPQIIAALHEFFDEQPGFGEGGENIIEFLQAPMRAAPHSLAGQLAFIRRAWAHYLGSILYRLLSSLDFIAEEEKPIFGGPGPVEIADFSLDMGEPERYTPDKDWMPRVILLAKNAYVWLDQLSRRYGRSITTLDQIPDEELDTLARWGITGLWLIGVWERSKASARIKQMMGNPEAAASAYSLYDYVVAADLGGPEAMANLRARAWARGIRLASDMVPNHMAIDSRWVIEHPDRFLSLDHSPFPAYTFDGPDLCDDPRVGVFLEDHYYTHTDAAVVFKRVDYHTGDERYIYHGNDGTSMPWNDTAQLDYLNPETREAVIQTILHVARQFPIIRFDAAMTLAKRHIQRLWHPQPGQGGAIPSRAEFAMTKAEFDRAMPNEFWREVVDRVAQEAPDTLLLAEAFWLLEGYFVRTLGMHRVYNSAFMHMLRDEDNAKYRHQIKSTLQFDPQILKRYVNFMTNPDEDPAVQQFGKGDKYFGVCTVMVTVPGLPMFGHGQFEGLAEKYGMEYRRAYWDEQPDQALIERHLREITPLLHRRALFADVERFRLYDFVTPDGHVDENVLAYSNRLGEERALIVYHNKFADTRGRVHLSVEFAIKREGENPALKRENLGEGLGLIHDPATFTIFRDLLTGLEYIRNNREIYEQGLYFELGAYQRHVLLDFRQVRDVDGRYARLAAHLAGRGVPSMDEALREQYFRPLHETFARLLAPETWRFLSSLRDAGQSKPQPDWSALRANLIAFLRQAQIFAQKETAPATGAQPGDDILLRRLQALEAETEESAEAVSPKPVLETLADDILQTLEALLALPALPERYPCPSKRYARAAAYVSEALNDDTVWAALMAWALIAKLGRVVSLDDDIARQRALAWLDEWLLAPRLAEHLQALGLDEAQAGRALALTQLLIAHENWWEATARPRVSEEMSAKPRGYRLLDRLLQDPIAQQALGVNRFEGVLWFNKEGYEAALASLFAAVAVRVTRETMDSPKRVCKALKKRYKLIRRLLKAERQSEYQVQKLLDAVAR